MGGGKVEEEVGRRVWKEDGGREGREMREWRGPGRMARRMRFSDRLNAVTVGAMKPKKNIKLEFVRKCRVIGLYS